MITSDEIIEIGAFVKPHGVKGEISAQIDYEIDLQELKCLIIDIDGIFVPFFVKCVRPKSSHSVLVTLDDVNSDVEAKDFSGKSIFALKADFYAQLPEDDSDVEGGVYLSDLIGFILKDDSGKPLGTVVDFDDSTANLLLKIKPMDEAGSEFFLPAADDLISEIDTESKILTMEIPDGILSL